DVAGGPRPGARRHHVSHRWRARIRRSALPGRGAGARLCHASRGPDGDSLMAAPATSEIGPGQALFRLVRFWSRRWTGAGEAVELEHARDVMVTEAVASLGQQGGATVNAV